MKALVCKSKANVAPHSFSFPKFPDCFSMKNLFSFLAVLSGVFISNLALAQTPPHIIITFSNPGVSIPMAHVPLLAAVGIILIVLIAGRMGKLRNAGMFTSIAASLVLAGAGLFYFDAVRAQTAQRTLELLSSPAMLHIQTGQDENVLVHNKTGQSIVLRSIGVGNDSIGEYSIASTAGTTCTSGLQLANEATCEIKVTYTAGGNGGGSSNSDFIDNPQTPDDFIERAEAIANNDPRIPLSTQEELEEAFKAEQDPEVVARKNRLQRNHSLVLSAVDPDPTWHSTEASADFIVAEPGSSYIVDLTKVDPDGNSLGAPTKSDQAKLRFEVRVQENDTTVNYVPSHSHEDYIRWDNTTLGRLHIDVPADLKQGRLLIGIRPKFSDKGQAAIAERWSTPVVLEIWPKRAGVTSISTSSIYYPTEFSESVQPRQGSAFSMAEISRHLEQAYTDFPDELMLKPLLVSGANLTVGQFIDARIPRPEGGIYPYGGKVIQIIEGANNQQMAILNFDLASTYELLESDVLISEGVMPEFVTYRLGAGMDVPSEGEPELEFFGPEDQSDIKSQQINAENTFKIDKEIKCNTPASADLVFTTTVEFSPKFDIALEYSVYAKGSELDCTLTYKKDFISILGKSNIFMRLVALAGGRLSGGPYADFKITGAEKSNGITGLFFSLSGKAGMNEGLSTPKYAMNKNGGATNYGLEATPSGYDIGVGFDLGANLDFRIVPPKFIFGESFKSTAGIEAKVGGGAGFKLEDRNAAFVKRWGESSSANISSKVAASLALSGGIEQMFRFIGFNFEKGLEVKFKGIESRMDANYVVSEVTDSGRGVGSVSFRPLSFLFPLNTFFKGKTEGYAALEGSSVYNAATDFVFYELDECASRGGIISTPLIVCTNESFCGNADRNANFCKPAWITPLQAEAIVGESAKTEGKVGTSGSGTVEVRVSGSPLKPDKTSFTLSGSDKEQEFTANATCTEQGVINEKVEVLVGGTVVDEQANILICNCKPGTKDCDRVWGDPYMVTADGMAYTYLATGNYILARVHDENEQPVHGLEVQANFLPGFGAAWLYSTAIQVGDDVVELRPAILGHDIYSVGLEVLINGEYLYAPAKSGTGGSWPQTSRRLVQLPGGGLIYVGAFVEQYWTYKPRSLTIIWPRKGPFDGYAVNVSTLEGQFREPEPFVELQFTRPKTLAGRERGLLGNNDGDPNNDFIRRNGQVLGQDTALSSTALYALFGGDWLVKPRECLFASGCNTEPVFATQPVALTDEQRALGEVACAGLTGFYREACINDVGLTGSTELVKEYYANTEDLNEMADRLVTPGVDIPVYKLSTGTRTSLPDYQGDGFRQAYQVTHQMDEGKFLLTIRPPRGGSAFFSEGSPGALKQSFTETGSHDISVDVQCDTPDSNWEQLGDAWARAGAVQLWALDPLSGFAKQLFGEKRLTCFSQDMTNSRIASGEVHSLFLDDEGQLWSWGSNNFGQLGNSSVANQTKPGQVDLIPLNGSAVQTVSAGAHFSMVQDDQKRLWAWGDNTHGQLGNSNGDHQTRPTLVDLTDLSDSTVQAFWSGGIHTVALDDQWRLWAWGYNAYAQLGDGTTINRYKPVQIDLAPLSGSKVVTVSAGGYHTMALDDQNRLWAWGQNTYGQLGDGSTTRRSEPAQVDLAPLNGSKVVAISTGVQHSLALDDQGRLWAWGTGANGRLGTGNTNTQTIPTLVDLTPLNDSKVIAVSAGFSYSLALDDQGRLWAWGYNYYGQLGNGNYQDQLKPVQTDLSLLDGNDLQIIWAGQFNTFVLDDQSQLWAWGNNGSGQLGDGTTVRRSLPVRVDMSLMNEGKAGVAMSIVSSFALIYDSKDSLNSLLKSNDGYLNSGGSVTRKAAALSTASGVNVRSKTPLFAAVATTPCTIDGNGQQWAWEDGEENGNQNLLPYNFSGLLDYPFVVIPNQGR